jgi:signal peptidase I
MKRFFSLIISLFVIVLLLKSFLIDAYYVASDSMKNTLLAGDFTIGLKAAYKLKTPEQIPFTQYKIPSYVIADLTTPQRNDIVLFRLNNYLVDERYSQQDLIKRIVALPGEKIQILKNKIFINDKKIENIFTIEQKSSISEQLIHLNIISPPDKKFSYLNYGPIEVPAKGDTIELNPKNIKFWQPLINFENNGKHISTEGTVIMFKNQPIKEYIIKNNYYFVLGDNLTKSVDSRILGFIPENAIESKILFTYLSIEPLSESSELSFIKRIRLNRILKTL